MCPRNCGIRLTSPSSSARLSPLVRDAQERDLPAIQRIYAHYVLSGVTSFEEEPPDVNELKRRLEAVKGRGLPYLVAEVDGVVLGYAYAAPYCGRPGYRHAVENSVYVDADSARRGLGSNLLERLIDECTEAGFRQMVAIIGITEDEASIKLYERAEFHHVGALQSIGFKHGQWVDAVFMQRALGEGDETPPRGSE